MVSSIFERLHGQGLISDSSMDKIKATKAANLFSVYWELKTLLYLGVLLLTTGLGILVYQNINYIGHTVFLFAIALISAAGYYYCFNKKLPFTRGKVASPNASFDYILLLAVLSFLIFLGYWQYQYHIFGDRYGMSTFIPTLVLFFTAYFFDQLGILSLAITNLAAWAGIVVTPARILQANDFNSETLILTGLALGIVLIAAGKASIRTGFKAHFAFTYANFGMHILFISSLAALFHFDHYYLLWFILLIAICWYFYRESLREKSFYLLLMLTLYGYVGLCYVVFQLIDLTLQTSMGGIYFYFLYFIGSAIGLVFFLIRTNRKLKKDDRL